MSGAQADAVVGCSTQQSSSANESARGLTPWHAHIMWAVQAAYRVWWRCDAAMMLPPDEASIWAASVSVPHQMTSDVVDRFKLVVHPSMRMLRPPGRAASAPARCGRRQPPRSRHDNLMARPPTRSERREPATASHGVAATEVGGWRLGPPPTPTWTEGLFTRCTCGPRCTPLRRFCEFHDWQSLLRYCTL